MEARFSIYKFKDPGSLQEEPSLDLPLMSPAVHALFFARPRGVRYESLPFSETAEVHLRDMAQFHHESLLPHKPVP